MKNILTLALLSITVICNGQTRQWSEPTVRRVDVDYMSQGARKDFSLLDRIYHIAKTINPNSFVLPNKDSLLIQFNLPEWIKLSDSELSQYSRTYFDALTIAMTKDSVKYKWVGVQVCNNPKQCGTSWYDVSKLKFMSKLPLHKKMTFFMQTNFWHSEYYETKTSTGKHNLIIYYFIDSTLKYAQSDYIEAYYQSVSCVIGDLLQKSKSPVRKKYEELIVLFCSNGRLAYYWRFPLSAEQMSKLYKVKYYERSLKQ